MSESTLKVAIVDPSPIVRSGLSVMLKRIQGYHVHSFEVVSPEFLLAGIKTQRPDLVIINPTYWGNIDIEKIKNENGLESLHFFAFVTGATDERITSCYANVLNIYDDQESIRKKLDIVFEASIADEGEEAQLLSPREKDIIIGVVKGMTNKEIANNLFLSAHTVITHRRNIARKLEIHSTAGLTIYAIVNKLVELNDIKQK
ncbi:MAG: response regulator transcription factor [Paludibacter sp.]